MQKRIIVNNQIQEFDRVLDKQRYPIEANEELKILAAEYSKCGVFEILVKAFNLGLIYGKRLERKKKT